MRWHSFTVAVLALLVAAAACTGSDSSPASRSEGSDGAAGSSADDPERTSAGPREIQTVEGALGTAFDLTVGWLNGQPIDELSYESLFADESQASLTFAQFEAALDEFRPEGPWTVAYLFPSGETELQAALLASDESAWILTLAIENPEQVVISAFFLSPAPAKPEVGSLEEAVGRLAESGALRFLAADVSDGSCDPILASAADEQAPLGSISKLYVLGAVIDAVAAGDLAWDTPVEIRSQLFSVPSGVTQDEVPGVERSVRELSERMISISDNTATDHLIDLLGRSAVEDALVAYGHSMPAVNRPFLSTREFTILKFSDDPDRRQRYADGSEEDRRAIADAMVGEALPSVASIVGVTDPVAVETLEWFASPNDLCRLLLDLVDDAEGQRILGLAPGVLDLEGVWGYLGFKGGSEPGVLAMAWYGTTLEGKKYVVAGSVANEEQLIGEADVVALFGAARDLTPVTG